MTFYSSLQKQTPQENFVHRLFKIRYENIGNQHNEFYTAEKSSCLVSNLLLENKGIYHTELSVKVIYLERMSLYTMFTCHLRTSQVVDV